MNGQNERGPAMLVNRVENVKQNVMENDLLADGAYIQVLLVTTVMEKVGRNASMMSLASHFTSSLKYSRTAEDLTVTSRKLVRYEELLNEIYPLVSPDVRNIIDDVRQQVQILLPLRKARAKSIRITRFRVRTNSLMGEHHRSSD